MTSDTETAVKKVGVRQKITELPMEEGIKLPGGISYWARKYGMPVNKVHWRLSQGWEPLRALTEPLAKKAKAVDINLAGKQFGDLQVIERSKENPVDPHGRAFFTCSCSCGRPNCERTVDVAGKDLRSGRITQCLFIRKNQHPEDNYEPPHISAQELEEFRKLHKWTIKQFAARLGYDRAIFSHIAAGRIEVPSRMALIVRLMQDKERLEAELAAARGES